MILPVSRTDPAASGTVSNEGKSHGYDRHKTNETD